MAETSLLAEKSLAFYFCYSMGPTLHYITFVPYHTGFFYYSFSSPDHWLALFASSQNCFGTHDFDIFIMTGHGSPAQTTGSYYCCEKKPYQRCQFSSGISYAWISMMQVNQTSKMYHRLRNSTVLPKNVTESKL